MTNQQPQQAQTPIPAPAQTPIPAPAQPAQQPPQPSMISFNTTAPVPAPVMSEPFARQASATEGFQTPKAENSAYDSIIKQQQVQIEALINQNNNLTQQVTQLVQGGAQFAQQPTMQPQQQPQQTFMPQQAVGAYPPVYDNSNMPLSLSADVDVSLESLASEIGKKPE